MDEARALEYLDEAGKAMVVGVKAVLPAWARREVARVLSAWGELSPPELASALEAAEAAGVAAAARAADELSALFALDPDAQRATPLEILRRAVREPSGVLAAAGVPEVVRDQFSARSWPDDRYDLSPRTFRDLDPDLAAAHFAWGMAKAEVLRSRRPPGPSEGPG